MAYTGANKINVWDKILIVVDRKEYPIQHTYLELLKILDIDWLYDIRLKFPFWNIKGIGKLELKNIDFNSTSKIMRINFIKVVE